MNHSKGENNNLNNSHLTGVESNSNFDPLNPPANKLYKIDDFAKEFGGRNDSKMSDKILSNISHGQFSILNKSK